MRGWREEERKENARLKAFEGRREAFFPPPSIWRLRPGPSRAIGEYSTGLNYQPVPEEPSNI